jgi:flagellar hook-associated protein 2
MMQSAINNDTNLKAKGITVQVSFDATNNRYQMSTDKFGSASTVNFTSINAALSADMGLVTGAGATGSYAGLDVMGSLDKDGNSYTFVGTGQHVKINSFLTGAPRDLEFDIAGTATGARGTLDFHRGFASQMTKSITDMLEVKNGAIGSKVAALTKKDTDFTAELAKVQTRYEQLLAQYTKQFSIVNSTISSMNNLKTTLSQTFKAN